MRRNAAGADPPSQMSSGLTGRGATATDVTLKKSPENEASDSRLERSSRNDSSNTAARAPSGTAKISRSAGMAERRPNTGSTRRGASAASEASCLATSTG